MRMLILEEKDLSHQKILHDLHAAGSPLIISDSYFTLDDCMRWLENNFTASSAASPRPVAGIKSRIVVKRGKEYQTLKVADVVCFFSENKVLFVVDKENRKYLVERNTLGQLQEALDKNAFYRVNRKYLVNADYIKGFKPMPKSRIKLEIAVPVNEDIIISQENSYDFRRWIGES